MGWKAVTESGRVYEKVGSGVKVTGYGYFHNADVHIVDREALLDAVTTMEEFWEHLRALPRASTPEVGKSLFIFTSGDAGWRLSTNIVSVSGSVE